MLQVLVKQISIFWTQNLDRKDVHVFSTLIAEPHWFSQKHDDFIGKSNAHRDSCCLEAEPDLETSKRL